MLFRSSASVADWGFPYGGRRAYYGGGYGGRGWRGGDWNGGGTRRPYPQPERGFEPAGQGWNRPAQSNMRIAQPFRYGQDYGRGYSSVNRQPQQVFNRPESAFSHTPSGTYGRYGYNGFSGSEARSGVRLGQSYGGMYGSYRAPQSNYERGFAQPSSRNFAQNDRSGGFHLFGRSHESDSSGGYKAPKSFSGGFKEPKGFGGYKAPKSFGGSGFKAPKAPKMSHSGGGGGHGRHR